MKAIHKYEDEKGQPPRSLEELVPEYLHSIPNTGMGAYPKYEYVAGEAAHKLNDNPWVLCVNTPSGAFDSDVFIYLPKQNYSKEGNEWWLERIDDWAYERE